MPIRMRFRVSARNDKFSGNKNGLSKKILKIKEAAWGKDEKLFERSEFFSSVEVRSVVFSDVFFVSLDLFVSFYGNGKKKRG